MREAGALKYGAFFQPVGACKRSLSVSDEPPEPPNRPSGACPDMSPNSPHLLVKVLFFFFSLLAPTQGLRLNILQCFSHFSFQLG